MIINIFVALYCHRDTDDSSQPVQFPCSHLWLSPMFSTSNSFLSLRPKSSFVLETFLLPPDEWDTESFFPRRVASVITKTISQLGKMLYPPPPHYLNHRNGGHAFLYLENGFSLATQIVYPEGAGKQSIVC